ncbi:hypothetical protein Gotri_004572 [Gossypium trilobum]|uniref:Uncharacterized protein n=1 Tax=Gossypium trilobum TaxID=34281 RepID=A0A7J9F5N9_9ROSI|nr:hypothetical protein [Gossypium trilobum]
MGGTKVLSAIQLVEDVHCVENINLVDWSMLEPICANQKDPHRGKSSCRKVRSVDSCKRNVLRRGIVRVRRRKKLWQKFRMVKLLNKWASWEMAEALRKFRGKSNQCHHKAQLRRRENGWVECHRSQIKARDKCVMNILWRSID